MLNGFRTFIGLLIAAVPTVANFYGYSIDENFASQAMQLTMDGITLVGLAIAFWGRLVAQAPGWFAKREIGKIGGQ